MVLAAHPFFLIFMGVLVCGALVWFHAGGMFQGIAGALLLVTVFYQLGYLR